MSGLAENLEYLADRAALARWLAGAYHRLDRPAEAETMEGWVRFLEKRALLAALGQPPTAAAKKGAARAADLEQALADPELSILCMEDWRDRKLEESNRLGVGEHEREKLRAESDRFEEIAANLRDLHRIYGPMLKAADPSKRAEAQARFDAIWQEGWELLQAELQDEERPSEGERD